MPSENHAQAEVIEISSGSENERPTKRQKTTTPPAIMNGSGQKNAHLKGRRRFNADLADMTALCSPSLHVNGFSVADFSAGDDEGAINFTLRKGAESYSIGFLVSDTSEYPKSHQFFASTTDTPPASYANILDEVVNYRSMPMEETVRKFLSDLERLTSKTNGKSADTDDESELEDDGSVDDLALLDEDAMEVQQTSHRNVRMDKLQIDWNDVIASGYRPGFIKFGGDDFSISISIPIVKLADVIPAQALKAWDNCLLSRSQHLCLLICGSRGIYPTLNPDGRYAPGVNGLSFKVGLTRRYKPSTEHAREAGRSFVMLGTDAEDEVRRIEREKKEQALLEEMLRRAEEDPDEFNGEITVPTLEEEEDDTDDGRVDKFSLSPSMESLMDAIFLKVVQLRRRFKLGWAGAEALHLASEKQQLGPELIFARGPKEFTDADIEERKMAVNYELPHDPLQDLAPDADINLPLTAFSYLVRRLMLCTRHCLVCFNTIQTDFQALKPYVCDSKLCTYQYYSLNRGPSLEYDILNNPMTVDLLVSMAYCAAREGILDDPLPIGMGIRVPFPTTTVGTPNQGFAMVNNHYTSLGAAPVEAPKQVELGADGLCQFDDLSKHQMRASIVEMIDKVPPIENLRRHLNRKVGLGKRKPSLKEYDLTVPEAAWLVLRWAVASCTAYIEETRPDERVRNIDDGWRQFRFGVGSPDAEAKFNKAVEKAVATNSNAATYPSLYAFHGSPMRNWHSILRHGLWFKDIAHGRAYGNGVYFAKDPSVSMGSYATAAGATWHNSAIRPSNCVAIAEIVNLPGQFVSSNPYFVVAQTEWIMCRHLLVKGTSPVPSAPKGDEQVPIVKLDPAHPLTSHVVRTGRSGSLEIPDPSYFIRILLDARQSELVDEDHDDEDLAIFYYQEPQSQTVNVALEVDEMDIERSADDWQHDAKWVEKAVQQLMPPPQESSTTATMALQREFKTMLKEQAKATSLKDLGWYMPLDFNQDNLFQWIVEMHSFDPNIPIAKDLQAHRVNSVVFEIRFPSTFPNSPPFFRVLRPRFLPFIHGGGGHITGGGSLCMDLLTADGWLPSYSISAVMIQIKLAISNLDPRPARLSPQWELPYNPQEALEGYKRAANTHGWRIPNGLDRLVL